MQLLKPILKKKDLNSYFRIQLSNKNFKVKGKDFEDYTSDKEKRKKTLTGNPFVYTC